MQSRRVDEEQSDKKQSEEIRSFTATMATQAPPPNNGGNIAAGATQQSQISWPLFEMFLDVPHPVSTVGIW